MKRNRLVKHLAKHGCVLLREGGKHSIYTNPSNNKLTAVGPASGAIRSFM